MAPGGRFPPPHSECAVGRNLTVDGVKKARGHLLPIEKTMVFRHFGVNYRQIPTDCTFRASRIDRLLPS